jgi:hypothetical protein
MKARHVFNEFRYVNQYEIAGSVALLTTADLAAMAAMGASKAGPGAFPEAAMTTYTFNKHLICPARPGGRC